MLADSWNVYQVFVSPHSVRALAMSTKSFHQKGNFSFSNLLFCGLSGGSICRGFFYAGRPKFIAFFPLFSPNFAVLHHLKPCVKLN
jgi:hypothetical protein